MKKILVCNQKMFLTHDEAMILKNKMDDIDFRNIELIVCPSYLNFDCFDDYKLGAQDAFYEDKGAYTSFVSAYDLSLRGVKYSLVGHSERRNIDTESDINLKIKALLRNSMTPILCVGETENEKKLRKTPEVIKRQLTTALKGIDVDNIQEIYIAYEPRYLIGGSYNMYLSDIEDALKYIKKIVDSLGISNYRLLYGGAINSKNVSEIISNNIDGFIIGNASLDYEELDKIVKCIK